MTVEEFYTEESYNIVKKYFPDGYQINVDYDVLIKLLAGFLTEIRPHIDSFNDLVDVDKCPVKFLPFLGSLIGYEYNYTISSRANRFIMKYLLDAYRRRGTEVALKLVARIAAIQEKEDEVPDEEKYYSYLFDPSVSEDTNKITLPRRWLFRWGNNLHGFYSSDYSTTYAYPSATAVPTENLPGNPPIDWYYNNATFDIYAPEITRLLRELMKWVIPAGMRVYWTMVYDMNYIDFGQFMDILSTDLQIITGENYRLIFFNYRKLGDSKWLATNYYEEDPEVLWGSTYSFDEVVTGLSDNTVYEYRIVIGFPSITDGGAYVTNYVVGQTELYTTPAYGYIETEGITRLIIKGKKSTSISEDFDIVGDMIITGIKELS